MELKDIDARQAVEAYKLEKKHVKETLSLILAHMTHAHTSGLSRELNEQQLADKDRLNQSHSEQKEVLKKTHHAELKNYFEERGTDVPDLEKREQPKAPEIQDEDDKEIRRIGREIKDRHVVLEFLSGLTKQRDDERER